MFHSETTGDIRSGSFTEQNGLWNTQVIEYDDQFTGDLVQRWVFPWQINIGVLLRIERTGFLLDCQCTRVILLAREINVNPNDALFPRSSTSVFALSIKSTYKARISG